MADDKTPKSIADFLSDTVAASKIFSETVEAMRVSADAMVPKMSELDYSYHSMPPVLDFVDHNHASEFEWRILQWINDFHRELSEEYEVGGQLVNFGRELTFSFVDVGYHNPSLISFKGTRDDGSPIELVQHVSQISILLIRQKRTQPDEPKRPIGFSSWDEYDEKIKNR